MSVNPLVLVAVIFLPGCLCLSQNGKSICILYQQPCKLLTAFKCCGFPLVECLPNNKNQTACLLPMDYVNLSPSVTSFNPFASVDRDLEAAGEGLAQLAQDPSVDPLASPVLDPLANPMVDPIVNPLIDPLVNPTLNPIVNPTYNPLIRPDINKR